MAKNSRGYTQKLNVIIAAEILGVFLMMIGAAPRELAFFILGGLVFFVIFEPLKQATLLALFSIPLYTALPIPSFDSFAVWRVIIAVLFLRVVFGDPRNFFILPVLRLRKIILATFTCLRAYTHRQTQKRKLGQPRLRLKQFIFAIPFGNFYLNLRNASFKNPAGRLGVLVSLFFILGFLSLFVAPEPIFGIRKLIYLLNIFALFFVIQKVVKTKQDFIDALKYIFASAVFVMGVAYAQFLAILFVPLFAFWQWWAHIVIPVFYGANLSDLLSYSNTWFAYYEEADATLRTFSIFPDSHSFALFMMLSLPIALTFFVLSKKKLFKTLFVSSIILILLAIILSGTRGVWIGALPVFLVLVVFWGSQYIRANILRPTPLVKQVINISLLIFILFALLFPVSSQLLRFSQMRQGGQVSDSAFERIYTSFSRRELSNKGRIEIWRSTLGSIAEHPFLGVGIGNYPVVLNENISSTKEGASAHSLYLDVISEMGILAGIVLMLIFFEILWKSVKNLLKSRETVIQIFSGFFAVYLVWLMTYSAVDIVLLNDKVLLLFTALVALLYAGFNKYSRV